MKRFSKGFASILIASLLMGLVALPDSVKSEWPDNRVVNWFKNPKITLGLDLQGGTQLDYRIDLRNALAKNEDTDPANDVVIRDVVEGVRTTIERRVNGLGVSEPNIFLSNVGDEQHIIVELAGIKDIEEAKATVGKTIQLEFKEPKTDVNEDERGQIEAAAQATLEAVRAEGADFAEIGDRIRTSDGKIEFKEADELFLGVLPAHYANLFPTMKAGEIHAQVLEGSGGYTIGAGGSLSEKKGLFIVQLVSSEVKERTKQEVSNFLEVAQAFDAKPEFNEKVPYDSLEPEIAEAIWNAEENKYTGIIELDDEMRVYQLLNRNEGSEQVEASHILIAYEGAERANPDVTRTRSQARAEAEKLLEEVRNAPDQFAEFAKEHSDGSSGANGGELGLFGRGAMTKPFEDAAYAMETGSISDVVETEFGFHLINVTNKEVTERSIDFQVLSLAKTDENREKLIEEMRKTEPYDVVVDEESFVYNEIFYDLTPDPWMSTGLDGSKFKYATVTYTQLGAPQVSIEFDSEGAKMFEDLTERLINQPMAIFVGGELISAPTVQQKITGGSAVITGNYSLQEALQLSNDLNTGAIDAPIILSGQYTISATLGETALHTSLKAGMIGLILLAIFMILYYRLMGVFAVLALLIYSIIMVFILKVFPIVMTLAGIAGIILSIGMAVDANILIFERTKEELKKGKNFPSAIVTGFERAWSSIRDSNVSSLITCLILWFFGNSIIRGFALMLGIGILMSMFTAITVTRSFLRTIQGTKLSESNFLLGVKKKSE